LIILFFNRNTGELSERNNIFEYSYFYKHQIYYLKQ
jgi:hypothetical protein